MHAALVFAPASMCVRGDAPQSDHGWPGVAQRPAGATRRVHMAAHSPCTGSVHPSQVHTQGGERSAEALAHPLCVSEAPLISIAWAGLPRAPKSCSALQFD